MVVTQLLNQNTILSGLIISIMGSMPRRSQLSQIIVVQFSDDRTPHFTAFRHPLKDHFTPRMTIVWTYNIKPKKANITCWKHKRLYAVTGAVHHQGVVEAKRAEDSTANIPDSAASSNI